MVRLKKFIACGCILGTTAALAHDADIKPTASPEKLGQVHFANSCSPDVQKQFDRAVALLHSFWYAVAEQAFGEIAASDPGCAIAHWGRAMTYYHLLWSPPTPADLKNGLAAVENAQAANSKTQRERDYIAAIAVFYQDADKLDHKIRAKAYEKAIEQLYSRYPEDSEAAIFYAVALDSTALPGDKTYSQQMKAARILEQAFREQPNHPGVAHYLIHTYDFPALAERGLPAARSYAKIAESSPHALHMPSHIFTRLGLWDEAIQTDLEAADSARDYAAAINPGKTSFERLHSMDYLVYAYLQGGQDRKAQALAEEARAISKADYEALVSAYAMAAIPARYALERHRWGEAAALTPPPAGFPWSRFPQAQAITHFARAIGAARGGDPAAAEKDIARLAALRDELASKDTYWSGQIDIQRRSAAAWLAYAKGKKDKALKLMESAAELESASEKHPVTPGAILPARELLADMLLELGRPAEALQEYERALAVSPNRFNGLYGAARAADGSGDRVKAEAFMQKLAALCEHADSDRPELKQVKALANAR